MKLRMRPAKHFLQEAQWTELFALAEHWHSDLNFFRDELHFLRKLMDRYCLWLTEEAHLVKAKSVVNELTVTESKREELNHQLVKHMGHIQLLMQNSFAQDEKLYRMEHERLEDNLSEFAKTFRATKKDVFALTEYALKQEKADHAIAE
jgi:hypothetical protein